MWPQRRQSLLPESDSHVCETKRIREAERGPSIFVRRGVDGVALSLAVDLSHCLNVLPWTPLEWSKERDPCSSA